jgi:hypothetical protein
MLAWKLHIRETNRFICDNCGSGDNPAASKAGAPAGSLDLKLRVLRISGLFSQTTKSACPLLRDEHALGASPIHANDKSLTLHRLRGAGAGADRMSRR